MTLKYLTLFLLIFAVICTTNYSCSKPSSPSTPSVTPPPPVDSTVTSSPDTSSIDVYVAGDTSINGNPHAGYWKNGLLTQLQAGDYSFVTSIYVDHKDVFLSVVGSSNLDSFIYWKNGKSIVIPDTLGYGHAIYALTMKDGDLYTTGTAHQYPYLNYCAVSSKNNDALLYLVPSGVTNHQSWGNAIAVADKNVFIAGYLDYKAAYWENEKVTPLSVDTAFLYNYSTAKAIYMNNGDVYIAGTINLTHDFLPNNQSIATYWKNNKPVLLTKDTGSIANAIAVVGNNIYVAGAIIRSDGLTSAAYWKNGTLVTLNPNYSVANAITIHGQDVFIAGTIGINNATYWKNGTLVSLGIGRANAIFISDK